MSRKRATFVGAAIVIALVLVALAGPARTPLAVVWWGWRLGSSDPEARVSAAMKLRWIGRPEAERYWPEVVATLADHVSRTASSEGGCVFVGRLDSDRPPSGYEETVRQISIERVIADSTKGRLWIRYSEDARGVVKTSAFVRQLTGAPLPKGLVLVLGEATSSRSDTVRAFGAFPIEDEVDERAVKLVEERLKR